MQNKEIIDNIEVCSILNDQVYSEKLKNSKLEKQVQDLKNEMQDKQK
tara:strand:+ start:193 stop:333 length:141 start_codon:yes stop_codon:yes gene_type:complete